MTGPWRKSSRSNQAGGQCVEWRKSSRSNQTGGNCVEWRKSSRSDQQGGACVEARTPDTDVFQVRDSKLGDGSPILSMERNDFRSLLTIVQGRR